MGINSFETYLEYQGALEDLFFRFFDKLKIEHDYEYYDITWTEYIHRLRTDSEEDYGSE